MQSDALDQAEDALATSPSAAAGLGDHAKHFFIFSTAGKPIYSYHGSEEALSELMATAKALMSVAQSQAESLRYLR